MRTKDQYTIAFIENDPRDLTVPFEHAYSLWWMNPRRDGGFRLSEKGCIHLLKRLELAHYEISIAEVSCSPRFILDLDRYIKTPYYIRNIRKKDRSILLFDKKTYFTLTMYNGDFQKFINAHKV